MDTSRKRKRQQRKVNFNTRKSGLQKKFNELKTLCDLTSCCLIMYDPEQSQIEALPKDDAECRRILKQYNETTKEERLKHNENVFKLLDERKNKREAELAKLHLNNEETKYPTWDSALDNMCLDELKDVAFTLDSLLQDVKIKEEEANVGLQILQPPEGINQFLFEQSLIEPLMNFQSLDDACPASYQENALSNQLLEWMDLDNDGADFTGGSMAMASPSNEVYVPQVWTRNTSQPSSDGICLTGGSAIAGPLDEQIEWANSITSPSSDDSNSSDGTSAMAPLTIYDYLPLNQQFDWNSNLSSDGYCLELRDGLLDNNKETVALDPSIDLASCLTGPLDFEASDNDRFAEITASYNNGNLTLEWLNWLQLLRSEMSCGIAAGLPEQLLRSVS